ncbi:DUF1467 family protein [Sulfitobacter aestuarii]|uniref:DUF1467 family protein n=1 Tax=Sulfitobacter aestuarii TaxID=2161676 RepID=A0ABW5U4D4_9RHOB
MGIVSGIVLFAVTWFMTFLIALPIKVQTQGDAGVLVPGTHAGAPEQHHLKKKALWTTFASIVLWSIFAVIILSGWISSADLERWLYPAEIIANGKGG